MIKVTSTKHIHIAAKLLQDMYNEIYTDKCSTDFEEYVDYIKSKEYVYIGDMGECLLIMKDVTPRLLQGDKLWDGEAVYIRPKFRKGKTLSNMYKFMFKNFKGSFIGMVEPYSEHLDVVSKRGKLRGIVYVFTAEDFKKGA
jgi:hypothetical protein